MVVVTGATGHLGTVLVRMLADSGTPVRYIARPGSTSPGLDLAGVERVDAGLDEIERLEGAGRRWSTTSPGGSRSTRRTPPSSTG